MRLTKFLKIVFKRVSTYIKDKVKFLKISFNLYVMRLGLSHENRHTKVNDKDDKTYKHPKGLQLSQQYTEQLCHTSIPSSKKQVWQSFSNPALGQFLIAEIDSPISDAYFGTFPLE